MHGVASIPTEPLGVGSQKIKEFWLSHPGGSTTALPAHDVSDVLMYVRKVRRQTDLPRDLCARDCETDPGRCGEMLRRRSELCART